MLNRALTRIFDSFTDDRGELTWPGILIGGPLLIGFLLVFGHLVAQL